MNPLRYFDLRSPDGIVGVLRGLRDSRGRPTDVGHVAVHHHDVVAADEDHGGVEPLGERSAPPGRFANGTVWQYVVLSSGIFIQPCFASYQAAGDFFKPFHSAGTLDVAGFLGRALFAIIAGLIIFPQVYRDNFNPRQRLILQVGPILAAGMGWQSLLGTALKAVSH